jgi:hypothetical protein
MDDQIIALFCLVDDMLKGMRHREDPQCQMSDAEVMTTAIVATLYFGGSFARARRLLEVPYYIPNMLSKSRFNRRVHRVKPLLLTLFTCLAEVWKELNADSTYSIDTFPIPACDNIRISRAKIYQGQAYRGYIPSKRRYFYGLKLHLMVTQEGQPVEFFLTPGSFGDVSGLDLFDFDLPPDSVVYADRAYNHYYMEDVLQEANRTCLQPMRKKNSKRPFPPYVRFLQYYYRKRIETSGSLLAQLLPKSIHAVTSAGFELKAVLFVLALSFNCLKVAT